jgi:hypothetical protein
MQEPVTRRVGRFVRLLAGRPPAVSKTASGRAAMPTTGPRAPAASTATPRATAVSTAAARTAAVPTTARFPGDRDTVPLASPAGDLPEGGSAAFYGAPRPGVRGRLTASGALLGMLLLCLVTCLVAAWRQLDVLAGLGYCAGCVLAPIYARRVAQLRIAVSAPVVFLLAEVVAQALTTSGSSGHATLLSVAEGTFLALAGCAPWLFAGTAVCIVIAMFRGLPQCVRDLRTGPVVGRAGPTVQGAQTGTALRDQRSRRR